MHSLASVSLHRIARSALPLLFAAFSILTLHAADEAKKSFSVPAGAAAQHLHRLAGNKAQLAQASHQSRLFSPLGAVQCLYNSVGASGQVGQRAQGLVGICHCAVFA